MFMNNSAARLHVILGKVRSMSPTTKAADAWRAILSERGPGDQLKFLQRFGRLMGMPLLVKNEILQIPAIDHEMYLRWIPQVEQAFFMQSLSGTVPDMLNRIDQNVLDRIEFCADVLARQRPEAVADPKDLAEIKKEVDELRRDIGTADVELAIKEYLCGQLDDVLTAIEEYDTFGILPLNQTLQAAVGSATLNQERSRRVRETPVGNRFWGILAHIAMVLNITTSVLQITARVENLLQPPDSISAVAPTPQPADQPHRPDLEIVARRENA
jgi:hypothetical protein